MSRRWSRALVLSLAVLAMASVSIHCGRTFVVSDMLGAPVCGGYVAPTLHNGLAWVSRLGAVSRPREFEVSADLGNVRLADVAADPFLWQSTLMNLSSLLSRLTSQPTTGEGTSRLTGELVDHFKGEYAAILDRYGQVLRPLPNMPASVLYGTEEEKRAWQAMVEKDLAQRPRWGDELKRRFGTEIELYGNRGTGRQ